MSILSVDEVKQYLGIDYSDTMTEANISRLINVADSFLQGSVGKNYPTDDPRAKEIALRLIAESYDNRSIYENSTSRRMFDDYILQLTLELRNSSTEETEEDSSETEEDSSETEEDSSETEDDSSE